MLSTSLFIITTVLINARGYIIYFPISLYAISCYKNGYVKIYGLFIIFIIALAILLFGDPLFNAVTLIPTVMDMI